MGAKRQVFNWTLERVNDELDRKIHEAYRITRDRAFETGSSMRSAAFDIAVGRVAQAIKIRGYVG